MGRLVASLRELAADISENNLFRQAAEKGHVNQVKSLLSKSNGVLISRNVLGETALHIACRERQLPVIQVLLDTVLKMQNSSKAASDASFQLLTFRTHIRGESAVHIACRNAQVAVVQYMLEIKIFRKLKYYVEATDYDPPSIVLTE